MPFFQLGQRGREPVSPAWQASGQLLKARSPLLGTKTGHKVPSQGVNLSLLVENRAPADLATHNQNTGEVHQPFGMWGPLTPFQEEPSPAWPPLPHSPTIAEPSRKPRPGQQTNGFALGSGGGALQPYVGQAFFFSPGSCSFKLPLCKPWPQSAKASTTDAWTAPTLATADPSPHSRGPLRFDGLYNPSQRNVSHSRHLLPCGQPGERLGPLGPADRKLAGPGLPHCQLLR